MRYAFFGGSFDPPHRGHLGIARAARARLRLDRILLAPVGRQPLKGDDPTPFAHRLAMVELLVAGEPGLAATAIDAPLASLPAQPNYTAETLPRLRALPPWNDAAAELFLLAGADSFLTLAQWREAGRLLQPVAAGGSLDGWILAARPGFPLDALAEALPPGHTLGAPRREREHVLTYPVHGPHGSPAMPIHVLADLDDPATATRIREALAAGTAPPDLTPAVARYIAGHGLYRASG